MDEHPGTLEVSENAISECVALVGARDQSGNVSDDEASVVIEAHHAQVRAQGGERVVGDLGSCGGDTRYQC